MKQTHSLSYLQLRMPQEAPLGWYTTNCECPVSLVCTFRRLLSKTQNASVRIVHLKLPTSLLDHVPGSVTSPNNITTAHTQKNLCVKRNHGCMCTTKWHSKSSTFGQSNHFVVQHAVCTLTYQASDAQTMKQHVVRRVTDRVRTPGDVSVPSQ